MAGMGLPDRRERAVKTIIHRPRTRCLEGSCHDACALMTSCPQHQDRSCSAPAPSVAHLTDERSC